MPVVDHIIVGHGLAGATLAVQLQRRGKSVAVFDRGEPITSSKVAAGLMTPITGKRFALTPGWDEIWPVAVEFYRRVEEQTGARYLSRGPAVRVFGTREERDRFEQRRERLAGLVEQISPAIDAASLRCDYAGFQMADTGRLNVAAFLKLRTGALGASHHTRDVQQSDVKVEDDVLSIGGSPVAGKHITFCEGFGSEPNPWFPEVIFEAAKGEILTIHARDLNESRTIHANGLWVSPIGGNEYRVGATYDWDSLDCVATNAARESLVSRLKDFLLVPFEVVGHVAAVRPIVYGRQPVIGFSRAEPRIGYINGLGSKGALLAPFLTRMYAEAVCGDGSIHPDFDLHQRFRPNS